MSSFEIIFFILSYYYSFSIFDFSKKGTETCQVPFKFLDRPKKLSDTSLSIPFESKMNPQDILIYSRVLAGQIVNTSNSPVEN